MGKVIAWGINCGNVWGTVELNEAMPVIVGTFGSAKKKKIHQNTNKKIYILTSENLTAYSRD